ncbi:hypothetical protein Ndes2526B_g09598 [Nannochloris sp. 'desiccata']|nr:putative phosphoinositide phosphatase SAC9 [Chlorella desiccata (nom. nud.)]KAH7615753.1 putative phosphoinositide phosphatase SAC9 [Chlorella desiccata (nom. nud.)]
MGHTDAGPFDPPIGRQSSVMVLSRRFNDAWGDYRIVITISTRSSTDVLEVNSSTGTLLLAADHSFTDEASALASCTKQGYMEIARGTTLLGFTATDTLAGLLLATKTTTKAMLPGGHAINLVTDARWELLPLDSSSSAANHPTAAAAEQEFWRSMQQHIVGGFHYYCETADLSRPFPSAHLPTEPELEFIWNAWLSQPFRDLGLPTHCPALMQGAVESVDEVHHRTGQRYTLCLLSRRSRRHPGTRYIARGLNEMAGPGNEIEAELLMWTPSAGSSSSGGGGFVKWARVAWRRGTVPIWWGVELQPLNKGLQAEVYIQEKGTYVGMLSYVRTLQRLCNLDSTGSCNGVGGVGCGSSKTEVEKNESDTNDTAPKVTFINLLHCNPKKAAELLLSSQFEEGMAYVKARLAAEKRNKKRTTTTEAVPCQVAPPSLKKFDWHGVMAMLNEEQGIEAFWTFIEHSVKDTGLALGVMEPRTNNLTRHNDSNHSSEFDSGGGSYKNTCEATNDSSEDISPWGERWQMRWIQRQRGLLRFNCADSLDRTNAATCFAMLPALQEGLRLLGINLENTGAGAGSADAPLGAGAAVFASPSKGSLQSYGEEEAGQDIEEVEEMVLPEGWERRKHAGRAVYIDHLNKVTQWEPPPGTTTTTTIKATKLKNAASSNISSSSSGSGTGSSRAPAPDTISPPWMFFNYKLEDVRSKLYADSVADYVTMFRKHGDVHSALYTGSPAMHGHVLGLVLAADARPYGTSSSSVGKLQNLRVAVQRRWNNSVSDSARQQSMELFLGLNMSKYFPRVTSVVPPHPTAGMQSDLAGIDEDDTLQEEEELGEAHVGAELENLHLRKHDGRVGVDEEISNLEPLEAPQSTAAAQAESSSLLIDSAIPVLAEDPVIPSAPAIGVDNEEESDDGSEALDPLGAVRSPIKIAIQAESASIPGATTTEFSLI